MRISFLFAQNSPEEINSIEDLEKLMVNEQNPSPAIDQEALLRAVEGDSNLIENSVPTLGESKVVEGNLKSNIENNASSVVSDDKVELDLNNENQYKYEAEGKKDPFSSFIKEDEIEGEKKNISPLQQFDLSEFKIVGIMWNTTNPQALITDPNGILHKVGKKSKIGRNNGYIATIREGEVVVLEPYEENGEIGYNPEILTISK